jgi:ABC-2 type transport system permease protein
MAVPFIIFSNIPDIAGWKNNEVYLIMSFMFSADGLCSILFDGIWKIPELVFTGEFDSYLSRPVSPLYQVISFGLGLQGIGVFLFGLSSIFFCLSRYYLKTKSGGELA